ncbi:MAG: hypothetical protein ACLP1X_10965 [Polyangiaceae bacterium]
MSAAYAKSSSPDEMFSSAHEQMEKMVAELRSTKMLSAEHSEVESFVQEQGRELERQLYQAHLGAPKVASGFRRHKAMQRG